MTVLAHNIVYLGIGTNIGDRHANIETASELIKQHLQPHNFRMSTLIQTEPWGFESKEPFLNGCMELYLQTTPFKLLKILKKIEADMGRKPKSHSGYSDRIIDLDILFFDELIINTPDLIIPHPLLHQRDFVLKPLLELTPKLNHPLRNMTIDELYNQKKLQKNSQ